MYFIEIDASFNDGREWVQYDGLVGPFSSEKDANDAIDNAIAQGARLMIEPNKRITGDGTYVRVRGIVQRSTQRKYKVYNRLPEDVEEFGLMEWSESGL